MAFRIVKARRLCDMATKLNHNRPQQQRSPAYLNGRTKRGEALPDMELVVWGGDRIRETEGEEEAVVKQALGYVMGSMKAELVEELKELVW